MRAENHISPNATAEFAAVIGLKHHVTAIRMRCWPKHPNTSLLFTSRHHYQQLFLTNLKRQFTNGTMSDGKRKNIVAFGKGRKRRREQLRHARSASINETGDSSTASTAVPVTPTRAIVSASKTDCSTVQVVSPPSVTVEPDSFLSIPSENSHPVVRQRVWLVFYYYSKYCLLYVMTRLGKHSRLCKHSNQWVFFLIWASA